jgi:hypothetical protein
MTMKTKNWTDESIAALPGTMWKGKGGWRAVRRITKASAVPGMSWFRGDVYWSRHGKEERRIPQYAPYFCEWLLTAQPANSAAHEFVAKYGESQ